MKKLLLLSSLLTLGATSFAAVVGSESKAEMPIVVRGTVVDKNGTNLIIEPLKNAGVNGASMEFDFGGIVQGEQQTIQGTFAVYKADKGILHATDMDKVKVGFLNNAGTGIQNADTATAGADSKVNLAYDVSVVKAADKKRIEGTIEVTAAADVDAASSSFVDSSVKLAVIVEA